MLLKEAKVCRYCKLPFWFTFHLLICLLFNNRLITIPVKHERRRVFQSRFTETCCHFYTHFRAFQGLPVIKKLQLMSIAKCTRVFPGKEERDTHPMAGRSTEMLLHSLLTHSCHPNVFKQSITQPKRTLSQKAAGERNLFHSELKLQVNNCF